MNGPSSPWLLCGGGPTFFVLAEIRVASSNDFKLNIDTGPFERHRPK